MVHYNVLTTTPAPRESDSYITQLWALESHTPILVFCYPCRSELCLQELGGSDF